MIIRDYIKFGFCLSLSDFNILVILVGYELFREEKVENQEKKYDLSFSYCERIKMTLNHNFI